MSSNNRIPLGRPKGALEEEGVWGAGAPHPLIVAKPESPGCLKGYLCIQLAHQGKAEFLKAQLQAGESRRGNGCCMYILGLFTQLNKRHFIV